MVFCHLPCGPFFSVDARIRCPNSRVPQYAVCLFSWILFYATLLAGRFDGTIVILLSSPAYGFSIASTLHY